MYFVVIILIVNYIVDGVSVGCYAAYPFILFFRICNDGVIPLNSIRNCPNLQQSF